MTGFSESEKTIIAHVARYHRGSLPKEKHAEFMQLIEKDRLTVARLGAILRLAEALDRGHENRIKDVKFKRAKQDLTLKLIVGNEDDCRIERQAIERKKDLFELAFDCNLQVL